MLSGRLTNVCRRLVTQATLANRQLASVASSTQPKPVESAIRTKLESEFQPKHIEVINESFMHKVPKGSETHFKVVVVSDQFKDVPTIERHRMVNDLLKPLFKSGIIAISIVAKSPDQWTSTDKVNRSPACRGGAGL